ncbi:MAG: PAS domain S-box protein [Salinivirgaceae bacterium]|nr:PAS domain S-box protein [Salinivirgaceae bacterium]
MADFKQIEALFENAPIGIFETTVAGKFIDLNCEFVRILGYSSKEDVFENIKNLENDLYVDPNDRKKILDQLKKRDEITVVEVQFKKKDGSPIDVRMSIRPHEKQGRNNNTNIGLIEDITKTKQIEQSKALKDQRYKALFDESNDAILIFEGMELIEWNRKALALFEDSSKPGHVMNFFKMHPEKQSNGSVSTQKAQEIIEKTLAGEPQFFEWEHLNKHGEIFHTEVSLNRITQVNPNLFQALVRDVTGRYRAEQELKKSEQRYRTIIDTAPSGILTLTKHGVVKSSNQAFHELLGYDKTQIIGLHFTQLSGIKIGNYDEAIRAYDALIQKHRIKPFTLKWESVDHDEKIVEIKAIVFSNSDEDNVQIIVNDMTDHYKMVNKLRKLHSELTKHRDKLEELVQERTEEITALNEELTSSNEQLALQNTELTTLLEKLRDTQSQLVHSEKMASVGILAAGIAHEINNPINYINSGVTGLELLMLDLMEMLNPLFEKLDVQLGSNEELLEQKKMLDKAKNEVHQLVKTIKVGVMRTTEIVSSLRTFSRIDDDKRTYTDLKELIDSALIILRNKYKYHIEIEQQMTKDNTLMGNQGKLSQVILNILLNAIQAIDEKGKIVIKTVRNKATHTLQLIVADNGCGIPERVRAKIFDPFYTTKPVGEGTGLGLSIVHGIVEDHKGKIHIDSTQGVGTKFTITLPTNLDEKDFIR